MTLANSQASSGTTGYVYWYYSSGSLSSASCSINFAGSTTSVAEVVEYIGPVQIGATGTNVYGAPSSTTQNGTYTSRCATSYGAGMAFNINTGTSATYTAGTGYTLNEATLTGGANLTMASELANSATANWGTSVTPSMTQAISGPPAAFIAYELIPGLVAYRDSSFNNSMVSGAGSGSISSVTTTTKQGMIQVWVQNFNSVAGASGTTAPTVSGTGSSGVGTFTKTKSQINGSYCLDYWEATFSGGALSSCTITISSMPTNTAQWTMYAVVMANGGLSDASSKQTQSVASGSNPSVTTAAANDVVLGGYFYQAGPTTAPTAGTGFTLDSHSAFATGIATYAEFLVEIENTTAGSSGTTITPGWATQTASPTGMQITVSIPGNVGAPAPGTPSAPTVVSTTAHTATIGIPSSYPSNTSSLDLQQSPDNVTFSTISTNVTLSSNVVASGLSSSTTYYWRVMAQGSGGSTPSTSVSGTTAVGVNIRPVLVAQEAPQPEEPIQPSIANLPPPGNQFVKNTDGEGSISGDNTFQFIGGGAFVKRTGTTTQVRVNAGPAPWVNLYPYVPGQIVTGADLNLYRCIVAHTGVDPTVDSGTVWQLYAVFGPITLYCGSQQRFSGSGSDPAGIVQALTFIQSAILPAVPASSPIVTIQVANGTYAYGTNTINISHPYAQCFQILGNTTTPASCTLTGTQSGTAPLIHILGSNTPAVINGFTLTGPSTSNGVGVQGSVNLGANMVIQTWQYGIDTGTATVGSSGPQRVYARSLTITGCGTGIQARFSAYVDAASATVKSCTTGILATSGGEVRANSITFTSNTTNCSPAIGTYNTNDAAYIGQTY